MAKRFPIPEFDYEELRGIPWTSPAPLSPDAVRDRAQAAAGGDASACGAWPVAADDAFFDGLDVRGPHRSAVACVLPAGDVTMVGRSHAWKIQSLRAFDGLPAPGAAPVVEWKTPRPMNTRLGPDDGLPAPARLLTLVAAHRYGDHWVGNRCAVDTTWKPGAGHGFRVLWADDEERNEFHCAVVSFVW